jgi:nucleotide-binding universal stress UspA family protein
MYQRILVPLDGSPEAEAALPHARSLASRFRSELVLVRVDEPIHNLPSNRYPPQIEEAATAYLKAVAAPMILKQLKVRTVVGFGDPVDVLVERIAEDRVDLVVVGARHPEGGLLPGRSFVHRLLRRSTAPVLVVRADPDAPPLVPDHG